MPDPDKAAQRASFGTSGHLGSSLRASFTEANPTGPGVRSGPARGRMRSISTER
jgi:hypothetical protein